MEHEGLDYPEQRWLAVTREELRAHAAHGFRYGFVWGVISGTAACLGAYAITKWLSGSF